MRPSILTPRQKEPADVYAERLSKVFYENYAGSIIDWYAATLFRREPELHIEGLPTHGRKFFNEFADDCDLKGSNLSDFFRKQLIEALVVRRGLYAGGFSEVRDPGRHASGRRSHRRIARVPGGLSG